MNTSEFAQLPWPSQCEELRRLLNLSCTVSYRSEKYRELMARHDEFQKIHDDQVKAWVNKRLP